MELGLNPRKRERDGERVAELGEAVDPGASGIAEAEQLGDLVVGFTGGVVEGAADERVGPGAVGGAAEIEVSMAAGDDQARAGSRSARFCVSQVSEAEPHPSDEDLSPGSRNLGHPTILGGQTHVH